MGHAEAAGEFLKGEIRFLAGDWTKKIHRRGRGDSTVSVRVHPKVDHQKKTPTAGGSFLKIYSFLGKQRVYQVKMTGAVTMVGLPGPLFSLISMAET